MDDTGERLVPEIHKSEWPLVYAEHLSRYYSIGPIVKDKQVLDVASGTGYGSKFMATLARNVVGLDYSKETVNYAQENYPADNLKYQVGDAQNMDLEDNLFDVVVSFETIEHLEKYEDFVKESKRVLKDDGIFVLSTPNDMEYQQENHFHLHQFTEDELISLVKKYYKNTKIYYQSEWISTYISEKKDLINEFEGKTVTTSKTHSVETDKCIYFIILASDRKITESISDDIILAEHFSQKIQREMHKKYQDHISQLQEDKKQASILYEKEIKHLQDTAIKLNELLVSKQE